ncbi:MAG: oligosaccharide flippase family protein [Bacteroidales bacterium]|nr:oligosaccharide flippase family protein [Bacteroidales bacterium]MCM1146669.1 oligosaccharide flippase family protein [Bacteroidales bacterium]MCM1206059.1 oligosaccharide flippase family protein [Bacillota bacterium]MCM1511038.1 oligosaccharide flippase family protein [Clostridium sp.]
MSSNSYKSILKAISLFSGVQGLNILLNIGRAKLAAIILGPAGIGLNAIYNEARELIHTSTNVGMDTSGVREIARAFGEKDKEGGEERLREAVMLTRSWSLLFAFAGFLLTFILSEPLSWMTFSDSAHAGGYRLLSLAVGFSTLTCGEMVVLRGIQKLKALATVSVMHVAAGLLTTIPVYYFLGIEGVVTALVLMTFSMAVMTMAFSYRMEKPRFCFRRKHLAKGRTMLIIGLSFVLSGFVASGSKLAVQSYINSHGSLETVGLYNSGVTLTLTYAVVVFASLDTDFFPRLASVFNNMEQRRVTVCRQMEMGLLLIFPTVVCAMFAMPLIVPILFSSEFSAVVPMAQIASAGLIFRALYIPAALIPLAAGESKMYLLLQALSYISFIPALIIGYELGGVTGTGVGLLVNHTMDIIVNLTCAGWRYKVSIDRRLAMMLAAFTVYTTVCYAMAQYLHGTAYVIAGTGLSVISAAISGLAVRKKLRS